MGYDLNASEDAQHSDSDEDEAYAHGLQRSETAVSTPFVRMHRVQS
jgi:hypothetical protein